MNPFRPMRSTPGSTCHNRPGPKIMRPKFPTLSATWKAVRISCRPPRNRPPKNFQKTRSATRYRSAHPFPGPFILVGIHGPERRYFKRGFQQGPMSQMACYVNLQVAAGRARCVMDRAVHFRPTAFRSTRTRRCYRWRWQRCACLSDSRDSMLTVRFPCCLPIVPMAP